MLHICKTCHLSTNVTNTLLSQNALQNCGTLPKQGALWCSTQKLLQKNLFCEKMHKSKNPNHPCCINILPK